MGATTDRYVVISSDCHGGASIEGYKPYLASRYHDDFDRWAASFENPYADNTGADADRNWSSERRLREMEEDGVVAEVLFPNTVPPFFPAFDVRLCSSVPSACMTKTSECCPRVRSNTIDLPSGDHCGLRLFPGP